MQKILILIKNRENRRLLINILKGKYDIITIESDEINSDGVIRDCGYDLGILDGPALDRYEKSVEKAKASVAPLFLPFLLITPRQDVGYVTRHLWKSIDELVITPIQKVELEARINILLRARKYSYEQDARLRIEREIDLIKNALNRVNDGIVALDKNWNFTYVNERALKFLGRSYLTDLLHKNYWEEFPEIKEMPISQALQNAWNKQLPVSAEYYDKTLDKFLEIRVFPSQEGLTILMTDISDRKRAEEELRQSEEKYRNIFQNVPVGIFRTRLSDGLVLDCNDYLAQMLGFENREELLAKKVKAENRYLDYSIRKNLIEILSRYGYVKNFEIPLHGINGSIVWVRISARLCDEKDCLEGVAEDITVQKQMEEALKESEERYRRLAENAPDIIYRYDFVPRRGFTYVNSAVTSITGYTPEEHYADPDLGLKIVHPEDRYLLEDLMKGGTSFKKPLTLRWIRKDGSVIWTEQRNVPIYDENGDLIAIEGIARDITDRIKAEEEKEKLQQQLLQLQKMESIGRLAGGIAHDFNNVLNVILGYGEIISSKLSPQDPLKEYVNQIIEAGRRAARLTQQLLVFSRKQAFSPATININRLIKNMEDMLRRLIGEDILLELSLDPNIDMVVVDPSQIEQVILNLAANARDAMPHGGKLYIKTTSVELDEGYVAVHPELKAGSYVLISVTDTGIGINKEIMDKIFEPFFTTKERGRGTGLGLSIVYGVIKQSNGHISVYSEVGKGTTFKIYLPAVKGERETVGTRRKEMHVGNGEHILLVEDEKSLRDLLFHFLTTINYEVVVATHGGEAVSLVEEKNWIPDLIITDVVMPHMNGRELVEILRNKNPQLKVIYMSGYAPEIVNDKDILGSNTLFMQKPFSPYELSEKIKEILRK